MMIDNVRRKIAKVFFISKILAKINTATCNWKNDGLI
jgi:hypothetical protein